MKPIWILHSYSLEGSRLSSLELSKLEARSADIESGEVYTQ